MTYHPPHHPPTSILKSPGRVCQRFIFLIKLHTDVLIKFRAARPACISREVSSMPRGGVIVSVLAISYYNDGSLAAKDSVRCVLMSTVCATDTWPYMRLIWVGNVSVYQNVYRITKQTNKQTKKTKQSSQRHSSLKVANSVCISPSLLPACLVIALSGFHSEILYS